jgi:mono/diheme cytochrome c family protein
MSFRWPWFVVGVLLGVLLVFAGAYLFVRFGGVPMDTAAPPLPFERTFARMALHAAYGGARDQRSPLQVDEANMMDGAMVYTAHCMVCHGVPGKPETAIARGMFPEPPQLFEKREMVTDDPMGITYWKVTNGIRLSGMPGFRKTLSDTERWQVTLLVTHADALSPSVRSALR